MTKYAPHHGKAAAARARAWVGKPYQRGMCQRFTNEIFGTGPVGDYDHDKDADALDGWAKAVAKGQVVPFAKITDLTKIPAGVMVYYAGGKNGHAAVGVGGRDLVSTDYPNKGYVGLVDILAPAKPKGHRMLGYVLVEGNGYTLTDPPAKPTQSGLSVALANLKPGKRNDDVSRLQKALNTHGVSVAVDGYYGPQTKAAVALFQYAQGWRGDDANGIPGPVTVARLGLKERR